MPQSSQIPLDKHQPGRRGRGPSLPMPQRLERLTDRSEGCWLWLGRTSDGYGLLTVNGKPRLAHRVSYETHVGAIPDGLQIDHLCRIRRCINPEHLEPVTQSVNMARAWEHRDGARKIECVAGHAYTEDNTYWDKGQRYCRECRRRRRRESSRRIRGSRPRQRSWTDHAKAAEALRVAAGEWQMVCAPTSAASASHTAHYIRSGKKLAAYQPAGAFEAEFLTVDGEFRVYARFVGSPTEGGAA